MNIQHFSPARGEQMVPSLDVAIAPRNLLAAPNADDKVHAPARDAASVGVPQFGMMRRISHLSH